MLSPPPSHSTSFRLFSGEVAGIATPLRLRIRPSTKWLWMGCAQPKPPDILHSSVVPRFMVKRISSQLMGLPFTVQSFLSLSNLKVRVILGASIGGKVIGAKLVILAGSALASATTAPIRYSTSTLAGLPAAASVLSGPSPRVWFRRFSSQSRVAPAAAPPAAVSLLKSMMMSARSATDSLTLVNESGLGNRLPSFAIIQKGIDCARLSGLVRKIWWKRDGPMFSRRMR